MLLGEMNSWPLNLHLLAAGMSCSGPPVCCCPWAVVDAGFGIGCSPCSLRKTCVFDELTSVTTQGSDRERKCKGKAWDKMEGKEPGVG